MVLTILMSIIRKMMVLIQLIHLLHHARQANGGIIPEILAELAILLTLQLLLVQLVNGGTTLIKSALLIKPAVLATIGTQ